MTLAIHLCRGNNRSQWYAEGGYDPIAETAVQPAHVDLFLLEYESERAGTFEPLRFVPTEQGGRARPGQQQGPGTGVRKISCDDGSTRRAGTCRLENLALSPQCGFASALEGNLLTEDEQWRKLQLVVDTARAVWPDA